MFPNSRTFSVAVLALCSFGTAVTAMIPSRVVAGKFTLATPVPVCMQNNTVAVDTRLWKDIVTNVCGSDGSRSLTADINAIQTSTDVGFPGYDDWSFALTWQYGQGDCLFNCKNVFNSFLKSKQCSADSKTFSGSGINEQACGNASFNINMPLAQPSTTQTATSTASTAGPTVLCPNPT